LLGFIWTPESLELGGKIGDTGKWGPTGQTLLRVRGPSEKGVPGFSKLGKIPARGFFSKFRVEMEIWGPGFWEFPKPGGDSLPLLPLSEICWGEWSSLRGVPHWDKGAAFKKGGPLKGVYIWGEKAEPRCL